jgi:hypothetical protein
MSMERTKFRLLQTLPAPGNWTGNLLLDQQRSNNVSQTPTEPVQTAVTTASPNFFWSLCCCLFHDAASSTLYSVRWFHVLCIMTCKEFGFRNAPRGFVRVRSCGAQELVIGSFQTPGRRRDGRHHDARPPYTRSSTFTSTGGVRRHKLSFPPHTPAKSRNNLCKYNVPPAIHFATCVQLDQSCVATPGVGFQKLCHGSLEVRFRFILLLPESWRHTSVCRHLWWGVQTLDFSLFGL